MRILRTCKEMGIKTVAVYSTADKDSLHVRFADEAVCIGPPVSKKILILKFLISLLLQKLPMQMLSILVTDSYQRMQISQEFVKKWNKIHWCHSRTNRKMGDKATAKSTMKEAGVPCVPGSDGLVPNYETAAKLAEEIGYPVMIKATAGGGGKGMRAVWKAENLRDLWDSACTRSYCSFRKWRMYMEKLIEEPRHIEIQIAGDQYGKACHLSERDCSVQRRNQKLTEETPSPFMTEKN